MELKIIRADRKTMSLTVDDNLQAVVRAPYLADEKEIETFVEKNRIWLENALKRKQARLERYNISETEKERLKKTAAKIIPKKVNYYAEIMGVAPNKIKITSAKKRFGSCSGKNTLCFSYYLMLYPDEAVDYVVVHELAHIKHHNHSNQFYAFVKKHMPDYREREMLLKSD